MRTIRALFCAGAGCFALFSASFAAADAVDDLLAGKPVVISTTPVDSSARVDRSAPGDAPANAPTAEQTLEQLLERETRDDEPLSNESFKVKLTEPSQAGLEVTAATTDAQPLATARTATLNLVPEPSAIILAVLSLVYFLIFFRRRYSF